MEPHLRQLEGLAAKLQETAAKGVAPDALIVPRLQKLQAIYEELTQATAEVKANEGRPESTASENELEELQQRAEQVFKLIDQVDAELAGEPWFNPPSQRRLLKAEKELSEQTEVLGRFVRKIFRKNESQYSNLRVVNVLDPEGLKTYNMTSDEPRREEDRFTPCAGIEMIVQTTMGSGKTLADHFGPGAHCAQTLHRILYGFM